MEVLLKVICVAYVLLIIAMIYDNYRTKKKYDRAVRRKEFIDKHWGSADMVHDPHIGVIIVNRYGKVVAVIRNDGVILAKGFLQRDQDELQAILMAANNNTAELVKKVSEIN